MRKVGAVAGEDCCFEVHMNAMWKGLARVNILLFHEFAAPQTVQK